MVSQRRRVAVLSLSIAIVTLSFAAACDKVPLLAPTGSVIKLFASSTTVPTNGEVEIIATVIENGSAPSSGTPGQGTSTPTVGSGTPVQNGTLVSFTTTIGVIDPREARTQNGEVRVRFRGNGESGTAKITAYSGGASGVLENVLVGSAAAKRIVLSASPQTLGSSGGPAQVTARVENEAGSPVAGVPVTFSTTAGSLSPTSVVTDDSGIARTTLTTTTNATVTANAGAATAGTVAVTVAARSGLAVSASPQNATAGQSVLFTITSAATANLVDGRIEYGDGHSRSLGSIGTTRTDSHVYSSPGNFPVTVTAREVSTGSSESAGTSVTVGALPITLTASPNPGTVGNPVTFTVGGTSSAAVREYRWSLNDGTTFETPGPQASHTFLSRGNKVIVVEVIGIDGRSLGSQRLEMNIN
jgi:hypothetical protein